VKREELVTKLKELLGSSVVEGSSGGTSQSPQEMAKKVEETSKIISQLEHRVATLEKELATKIK